MAPWLSRLVAERQLVYVLSTKGKPFLDALLAAHDVRLPSERVIGKAEPKREKWDVLRELAALHGVAAGDVWFVEDRLRACSWRSGATSSVTVIPWRRARRGSRC
jgi:hypothetical protein